MDPILFDPQLPWPSSTELLHSDNAPVGNELQNLIPNLLFLMLSDLWAKRDDWFFGIDMGVYYLPDQRYQPLIPDGFLSVGVPRRKNLPQGRLNYVSWEENNIVPILALECVSQNYREEYDQKAEKYVGLGVRYYVIYNPHYSQRDGHDPLEVYELRGGYYERLFGEPIWLEALGIGIDRAEAVYTGWQREWLFWYSEAGRTLTPDEQIELERQRAEQEKQRADALAAKLRSLGLDPTDL